MLTPWWCRFDTPGLGGECRVYLWLIKPAVLLTFAWFLEADEATLMSPRYWLHLCSHAFQSTCSKSDPKQIYCKRSWHREATGIDISHRTTSGKIHLLRHYCMDYKGTVELGMLVGAHNNIDPVNNTNISWCFDAPLPGFIVLIFHYTRSKKPG